MTLSSSKKTINKQLSLLEQRILKTLLYYKIFSYPMTAKEIMETTNLTPINLNQVQSTLNTMQANGLLYCYDNCYLTIDDPALVVRRFKGNERAQKYLKIADKMSRWINQFPFVRGVMVSGSLSKYWMGEDGDIDYFIVTKSNRLWIARSLLILFKKVFLFNSKKYFCVNYFVDEEHLEIEEKNQFTATEIVTVLPTFGKEVYNNFHLKNEWVNKYYPNFPRRPLNNVPAQRNSWIKAGLEKMLNGKLGTRLDAWFMKKTVSHWNKKFKDMDPEAFAIALKSRNYVSKHHPNHFQKRVISNHVQNMVEFETLHGVSLCEDC